MAAAMAGLGGRIRTEYDEIAERNIGFFVFPHSFCLSFISSRVARQHRTSLLPAKRISGSVEVLAASGTSSAVTRMFAKATVGR